MSTLRAVAWLSRVHRDFLLNSFPSGGAGRKQPLPIRLAFLDTRAPRGVARWPQTGPAQPFRGTVSPSPSLSFTLSGAPSCDPSAGQGPPRGRVPSLLFSCVTTLCSFRGRLQRPLRRLLVPSRNCVDASPWKPLCEAPSCVCLSGTGPTWSGSWESERLLIDGYRLQGALVQLMWSQRGGLLGGGAPWRLPPVVTKLPLGEGRTVA